MTADSVGRLPGAYPGAETESVYFLMKVDGRPGNPGAEARSITWAPLDRASDLLRETTAAAGRERDLRVLEVALELLAVLPKGR